MKGRLARRLTRPVSISALPPRQGADEKIDTEHAVGWKWRWHGPIVNPALEDRPQPFEFQILEFCDKRWRLIILLPRLVFEVDCANIDFLIECTRLVL